MDQSSHMDLQYTSICSEKTLQSDKNGFFLQFADHVLQSAGKNWLTDCFSKLKTDRDRIKILFTDEQVKGTIYEALINVQCIYRKKDAKISRDRRMEGADLIKNGNMKKALMLLCQSVLRAPLKDVDKTVDKGKTLSLSLWYRSHILMEMGHIHLALNDLQLAQREGLPEEHLPELYSRMAECYHATNEPKKAKVAAELAKKFGVTKISIHIMKRITDKNDVLLPNLTSGFNKTFTEASSLLKLKQSREMGRYMVAGDHIKTGDTLVVESPQVACLLPDCFGSHCHHCFKSLLAPVGCPNCSALAFCSVLCRDAALSTYHQHECRILDLLIGSGMSVLCHTALRMVTQEKNIDRSKMEKVYKLCAHSERRDPIDLLRRTLMAAFLLRCLQISGYFGEREKENLEIKLSEQELTVGEMLLTNLQILQFNAHEIYETRRSQKHKFRGSRAAYIGVGLYPTTALLNHECYPAVTRYFIGKNIIIRATRPLVPGELVAENYGPHFLKRNVAERRRMLESRYWFQCQCQACREDWPVLEKIENTHGRFRCPTKNCNNLFSQPVRDNPTCLRCNKKVNLVPVKEKIKICEQQFKKGIATMDAQEPDKAVPILCQSLDNYHRYGHPPHKDAHLAQESLRTCLADLGNIVIV